MEPPREPTQPEQPPPPADEVTPRLDGLRAWIATLDRMIEIRTLIGLVLVALAVGASGAAIYLAQDSANSNDADLSRLRTEVDQARRDASGSTQDLGAFGARIDSAQSVADAARAETERLRAQIRALRSSTGGAANESPNAHSGGAANRSPKAPSGGGNANPAGGSSP